MRLASRKAGVVLAALAMSLSACGNAGGDSSESLDTKANDDAASNLEDGTFMKKLADAGKINIGVKFDQPGLGFKSAASDTPTGFDVEIAKLLAAELGLDGDEIKWVETVSDNREPYLQQGKVDLVLATYSITPERQKLVGQAGPYMVTGQQLLVKNDAKVESIKDLKGKEVCSVTGSTSLDNVKAEGMKPVGFDSYSECVDKVMDGTVEAMSTDGSILLGYAAENEGELKVVGDEFSEERIGVGYPKQETEMCQWITDTLTKIEEDGKWEEAWDATLGKSGEEAPEPPKPDACKA